MPISRAIAAPPAKSVDASGGRSTSSSTSVATRLNVRSNSAFSCSALATRGRSSPMPRVRALPLGLLQQRLERAVAAQQLPPPSSRRSLAPRATVGGVAAQRDEVGHLFRRYAVALEHLVGSQHSEHPALSHIQAQPPARRRPGRDRDPRSTATPPARLRLHSRERAHRVVGLQLFGVGDRPTKAREQRGGALSTARPTPLASGRGGRGRRDRPARDSAPARPQSTPRSLAAGVLRLPPAARSPCRAARSPVARRRP